MEASTLWLSWRNWRRLSTDAATWRSESCSESEARWRRRGSREKLWPPFTVSVFVKTLFTHQPQPEELYVCLSFFNTHCFTCEGTWSLDPLVIYHVCEFPDKVDDPVMAVQIAWMMEVPELYRQCYDKPFQLQTASGYRHPIIYSHHTAHAHLKAFPENWPQKMRLNPFPFIPVIWVSGY